MIDRGDLFTSAAGGKYRLLGVTTVRGKKVAHVYGMDHENALPKQWKLSDITEGLESGLYQKCNSRELKRYIRASDDAADSPGSLRPPAEVLREWRWKLIKPLVDNPLIFYRKHRGQLVKDRALEMDASENTVMKCLRLYWHGGMTKDALLADFANCGKSQADVSERTDAPRGRTPRNQRYEKFQWVSAAQRMKVLKAAKTFFSKSKTNTQHRVYRHVVSKFFSTTDSNGKPIQLPLGQRPTRSQVMYLLESTLTLEAKLRRSMGDDEYNNNAAPKTGSARDYANGIGQYFEIDATIPDQWICADEDRNVVIGKGTLYLIIDAYSRLIVGFHFSLDAPSWAGALEAIMSLVESKEELCRRWGLEYDPEDWPAHGYLPQQFRADRGPEMVSKSSDSIADGLEIAVANLPPRNAPGKGTIECGMKLVQTSIRDHGAGHTPSSEQGKRQTNNHKGEATNKAAEVVGKIYAGIRLHNRKVHTAIELPAADIYKGLQPIPMEMWKRDHKERAGSLSRFEPDDVRFKLLPRAEFTMTPVGLHYEGLLWEPESSQKAHWLLPSRLGFYKVTASYHSNLVDRIYVHDSKDSSKWTVMHLTDKSIMHAGKTFAHVKHVKDVKWTLDQLAHEHNLTLELQEDQKLTASAKHSAKLTQAAINKAAGKSRTTGALEKRAQQAERDRQKTPGLASTAERPSSVSSLRSTQPPTPRLNQTSTPTSSAATSPTKANAPATSNQGLLALMNIRK